MKFLEEIQRQAAREEKEEEEEEERDSSREKLARIVTYVRYVRGCIRTVRIREQYIREAEPCERAL
jgi:hypothetical protein